MQPSATRTAARLESTVDPEACPSAEVVVDQCRLGLRETEFPRHAGILYRRQRAGTGATVAPGDMHDICETLHDSCRDRADAFGGDELH